MSPALLSCPVVQDDRPVSQSLDLDSLHRVYHWKGWLNQSGLVAMSPALLICLLVQDYRLVSQSLRFDSLQRVYHWIGWSDQRGLVAMRSSDELKQVEHKDKE